MAAKKQESRVGTIVVCAIVAAILWATGKSSGGDCAAARQAAHEQVYASENPDEFDAGSQLAQMWAAYKDRRENGC